MRTRFRQCSTTAASVVAAESMRANDAPIADGRAAEDTCCTERHEASLA